jgi:hypothetical protein
MVDPARAGNSPAISVNISRSQRLAYVVERLVALGLALVFLRSASAHLANPYYFLSTVYSYKLTGIEPGIGVALILPFLQFVIAACLLAGWWLRESYVIAFLLFSMFATAQTISLTRGQTISCGCFGASESLPIGAYTFALAGLSAGAAFAGGACATIRLRERHHAGATGDGQGGRHCPQETASPETAGS